MVDTSWETNKDSMNLRIKNGLAVKRLALIPTNEVKCQSYGDSSIDYRSLLQKPYLKLD